MIPFLVALALSCLALPAAASATDAHPPHIRLFAPSEAVPGDTVRVGVLVSSRWGREGIAVPTAGVDAAVALAVSVDDPAAAFPSALALPAHAGGAATFDVVFGSAGLWRVTVSGDGARTGTSAPIRVRTERPEERILWGDLHGHLHTPGAGHAGRLPPGEYERLLEEGFAFARDIARLDFAAFSPHLQTAGGLARAAPGGAAPWDDVLAAVDAFHRAGRFVTFPAFEWQGDAGDHVVVYPAPGPLEAPADFRALCASVKRRGALLTAHAVVLPSGFTSGLAALGGVEVTRDTHATEWLGVRAIERGIAPAFLGCSDTHGGALGATSITGIRARSLTREGVMDAIRARRTWATNGERIVLDFTVEDADPHPVAHVRGVGTAPLERIELRRDGELVATRRDLGDALAFDVAIEDRTAPPRGSRSAPPIYHARVVQTSRHRYDPSQHDQAISSPVVLGELALPAETPPGDPIAETSRGRELREAFESNWGYTSPGAARVSPVAPHAAGPAPWRRECGTVVPGHDVARPRGFGALDDGRAVIALADAVVLVDPASGEVRRFPFPDGRGHEAGRAFCVVDREEGGVLLRGADAGGGWAGVLDPVSGAWSDPPPRVADGTFTRDAHGELVCLVARRLERPGRDGALRPVPVSGRLLAVTPGDGAVIRTVRGNAVRVAADGSVTGHVPGPVLAVDPGGAALVLAGLSARHAELATAVYLSRALPGGAVDGPFRLDVRASPVSDPPVAAAFTPNGALLLLGGANGWRREPDHDWWGAAVERWTPR